MSTNRRRRHSPEQIVRKLRDADAMLNSGKQLSAVLQSLEVSGIDAGSLAQAVRRDEVPGGGPAEEAGRGESPAEAVVG